MAGIQPNVPHTAVQRPPVTGSDFVIEQYNSGQHMQVAYVVGSAAAVQEPSGATGAAPPAVGVRSRERREHGTGEAYNPAEFTSKEERTSRQHGARQKGKKSEGHGSDRKGAARNNNGKGKHDVQRTSPSDNFSGKYAVDIKDLSHSYSGKKDKLTLDKVNLQIQKGTIYGLLGPSGCGKTTLIKCMLSQLKPMEGSLSIFGEEPGTKNSEVPGHDVGYMPQELALYDEFTIEQNMSFYAKLHGMSTEERKDRTEYLCKLLELQKTKNKVVGNLSGGQKRRCSLACGLLHKPKLLILDEPTVGVDPTLRSKIWKYLTRISRDEGTTILLTTHYIEEARRAHAVGLMRDGKMLEQGTPKDIMKKTGCKTLEAAFLKICKKDEKKSKEKEDKEEKGKKKNGKDKKADENEESESSSSDEEYDEDEEDDEAEGGDEVTAAEASVETAGASKDTDGNGQEGEEGEGEEEAASPSSPTERDGDGQRLTRSPDEESQKDESARHRKSGQSKEYDEESKDADDENIESTGGGKARSKKDKKKTRVATFEGVDHNALDEPLLGTRASPTPGGYSKSSKQRGSAMRSPEAEKHLQSPEPTQYDEDADEENQKWNAKKGTRSSKDDKSKGKTAEVSSWDTIGYTLSLPRWNELWGLVWKNIQRMIRGVAALIFQFILPSIQVILFCVAIGKDPQHIHMGLVNWDQGAQPSQLQSMQNAHSIMQQIEWKFPSASPHQSGTMLLPDSSVSAHALNSEDPVPPVEPYFLSKTLREKLDDHFIIDEYSTLEAARDAVEHNTVWGFVFLPTDFTANTLTRINETIQHPLEPIDPVIIANSTMSYTLDMSNEQMTVYLVKSISGAYLDMVKTYVPEFEEFAPVQMKEPVYGDDTASFTDFVAPGIIITIAFSGSIGMTAIIFVLDKKTGIMDRIWSAGIRSSEIMLSQVLTQLIIFVIQIGLLLIFGLLAFKLPMKGSVPLLYFICIILGVTGMMFGLVIASKVTEERDAMQCALGSFFPALLLSGVIWPVEAIPRPLYYLSLGLPTTWAAEAGRSIMSRGWGIEHQQVWLGIVVPLAWSFVFFLWAARSLRPGK